MKPRIKSELAPSETWCNGRAWNLTMVINWQGVAEPMTVRCRSWVEARTMLWTYYERGLIVR